MINPEELKLHAYFYDKSTSAIPKLLFEDICKCVEENNLQYDDIYYISNCWDVSEIKKWLYKYVDRLPTVRRNVFLIDWMVPNSVRQDIVDLLKDIDQTLKNCYTLMVDFEAERLMGRYTTKPNGLSCDSLI